MGGPSADPEPSLIFRGTGLFNAKRVRVECRASDDALFLRVGRDPYRVAKPSGDLDPRPPDGPAVLVSLAVRGLFSLHAGAVSTPRGVVAFIGRSGAGKSTLAAHLASRGPHVWPQVTDDILPVALASRPPLTAPHAYPGGVTPGPEGLLPLAAIYVLRSWRRTGVASRPLSPREATVALIRQSVATRLFDAPLKAAHFEGCANAAASIPVRELIYPRTFAALESVRRHLAGELALG